MKIDPESVARARARLERVFLHWRRSGGESMAIIDQKLLVLIIKEYESRHQTLPISRSTPPRGRAVTEPVSPPPSGASGQAPTRGGVIAGEHGDRRPVPVEAQPPPPARKPVGLWLSRNGRRRASSSLTPQESGSTEQSSGTGSSVSGGEEGCSDERPCTDEEQTTLYGDGPDGDQEFQFARSAAQSALTPGFFKMDESQWLDDLATALPAAGRHEIHYTNAAGYWLGLSMTASEMSEEIDRRSKDDITGLLAFSSVLAKVAARVLATRFTYFDIVVTAGLAAGANFAASVESPEATRGSVEAGADFNIGPQFSASDLSNLFPPKHRESDL